MHDAVDEAAQGRAAADREGQRSAGRGSRGPGVDWRLIHRYWACAQRHASSSERGRQTSTSSAHTSPAASHSAGGARQARAHMR